MRAARLQGALERLSAAIGDVETELAAMKAEHDPPHHTFSFRRRHYRNTSEVKSGKRRDLNARLSFNTARELGFRGRLEEWESLMGAPAKAITEASTTGLQMTLRDTWRRVRTRTT